MQIVIDGDACPVISLAVSIAKSHKIPTLIISDRSHEIKDDYGQVIQVDGGRDAADFKIMGLLKKTDILITQDFGLAAMAIGKGAKALNQNGLIYTENNIDNLLMERHQSGKLRRAKKGKTHLRGPSKRTREDDEKFLRSLQTLLKEVE